MEPQQPASPRKRVLSAWIPRPLKPLFALLLLAHWAEAASLAGQAVTAADRAVFVSFAEAPDAPEWPRATGGNDERWPGAAPSDGLSCVPATPEGPKIGSQPASVSVEIGHTARFDLWAYGAEPLTYQWRKNGVNLPAATNCWLILSRATAGDVGTYDLVVTDPGGSAQSAPATLTVLPTPPPSGPGSVDLSFPVALGWAGPDVDKGPTIYEMVKRPDGKLLVGCAHDGVTRLLPDGGLDTDLAPGTLTPEFGGGSGINALALQNDGRILVGGAFTDYDAMLGLGLVRLNNDVPTPFVRREIARPRVQLIATPPTNVGAYSVEDRVQPGAVIANISDAGVFDAVNRRAKWGPFSDNTPRTLGYQAVSPATAGGTVSFTGPVSFDGTSQTITGLGQLDEGCRLEVAVTTRPGEFHLTLSGRPEVALLVRASSDLLHWTPVGVVTNRTGSVEFTDLDAGQFPQRFYERDRRPDDLSQCPPNRPRQIYQL